MEKLEFADFGLVEMNETEMNHVDGGVIGWDDIIIGFAIAVIYDMGKNDGAKNRGK